MSCPCGPSCDDCFAGGRLECLNAHCSNPRHCHCLIHQCACEDLDEAMYRAQEDLERIAVLQAREDKGDIELDCAA